MLPKSILVGVDGSDGARRAAEFARDLARSAGARVILMHVVEPLPETSLPATVPGGELRAHQIREGQRILEETTRDLGLGPADVVEPIIELGRAPEALCAEAEDRNVDLIVLGAHGTGPYRRVMAGTVGTRVMHLSNRTVTLVR